MRPPLLLEPELEPPTPLELEPELELELEVLEALELEPLEVPPDVVLPVLPAFELLPPDVDPREVPVEPDADVAAEVAGVVEEPPPCLLLELARLDDAAEEPLADPEDEPEAAVELLELAPLAPPAELAATPLVPPVITPEAGQPTSAPIGSRDARSARLEGRRMEAPGVGI